MGKRGLAIVLAGLQCQPIEAMWSFLNRDKGQKYSSGMSPDEKLKAYEERQKAREKNSAAETAMMDKPNEQESLMEQGSSGPRKGLRDGESWERAQQLTGIYEKWGPYHKKVWADPAPSGKSSGNPTKPKISKERLDATKKETEDRLNKLRVRADQRAFQNTQRTFQSDLQRRGATAATATATKTARPQSTPATPPQTTHAPKFGAGRFSARQAATRPTGGWMT